MEARQLTACVRSGHAGSEKGSLRGGREVERAKSATRESRVNYGRQTKIVNKRCLRGGKAVKRARSNARTGKGCLRGGKAVESKMILAQPWERVVE